MESIGISSGLEFQSGWAEYRHRASASRDFWKSLKAIGGPSSYQLAGAFGDAEGQPGQSNSVSHGCVPSLFQQTNIINTGRRA